jgi:uncharacterized membrane protein
MTQRMQGRDVAEIIIGSLVLAFPVALTEEVWNLSVEMSFARALVLSLSSLVFISFFVKTIYRHDFSYSSQKQLLKRVMSVYGLTLLVAAAVLFAIDKLPLMTETMVAVKRTIIVAFAASFAATVVDSLGD